MEAAADRKEGILVIRLKGRLDGYGANILQDTIMSAMRDDDISLIIDMSGVPYLSSAGIRIFLAWKKKTKDRNGDLILAEVQEFPKKVLEMAGFLSIIPISPSVGDAVATCSRKGDGSASLLMGLTAPPFIRNGVRYTFESAPAIRKDPANPSGSGSSLVVTGSLGKVMLASLTRQDIKALKFSDTVFSLGLGALGMNTDEAMPLMGEMITLKGSMVWIPTDGHMTPDFFTPVKDTGGVQIYSGFCVGLKGPFHDTVTMESLRPEGITLSDLYRDLFSLADERRKPNTGVLAMAMWGIAGTVFSSEIRHSPLRDLAPLNHGSIMDPANYEEWNATAVQTQYSGDTLVSFGFGIDLSRDLSGFDQEKLDAIHYVHPKNRGIQKYSLHNHGVIFKGIPWDAGQEFNRQIGRILAEGQFIDMRHLMDETRILKARCGIAYISDIILES